jgi:tetratricopeptide (TPR) repeat protein
MPERKDSQFRERFTEVGATLMREERPTRPQVDGLVLDTSFDITELADFAASSVEKAGDVEKLRQPTEGGLGIGELDSDNLDEALNKIQQQQLSEQIESLLNEAVRLIEQEQYGAAILVLDQGLEVVPGSIALLYLKAHCLFSLGYYEEAYDLLTDCREGVTDSDTLLTILSLQGACARAILDDIEARLEAFKEKKQYEAALRLMEDSLRRMPYSPTLLYHRCGLLLVLGRLEQARQAALVGIERGGEENAELFQQMYDQAVEREVQPLLEPVRQALREQEANTAIKLLQSYRTMLAGQERYESARAYAHEKNPSRGIGGGLRALFSRDKEPPPEPLTDERRQRTLQWLLAEELDAGYDAMEQDNYQRANTYFRAAEVIDGNCNIVNYLHALSLYRGFLLILSDEKAALDLHQCMKNLQTASGYLRRAAADPLISERATTLGSTINDYYEQLLEIERERQRREEEAKPINELLVFYNETMDYLEKHPIGTVKELEWARSRFRQVSQKAESVRRGRTAEQGAEILGQLITAANKNLRQVDQIEADVKVQEAIGDCVTGFTQMIDHYKRYPISNYTEKYRAQERVKSLLEKVASTRVMLGYDSSRDSGNALKLLQDWPGGRAGSYDDDPVMKMVRRRTKPASVDQETWDVLNQVEAALLNVQKQLSESSGGGRTYGSRY